MARTSRVALEPDPVAAGAGLGIPALARLHRPALEIDRLGLRRLLTLSREHEQVREQRREALDLLLRRPRSPREQPGRRSPSPAASSRSRRPVSGVRSWCEALATNSRCASSAPCSRCVISLNAVATCRCSREPRSGARASRSPPATRRAAAGQRLERPGQEAREHPGHPHAQQKGRRSRPHQDERVVADRVVHRGRRSGWRARSRPSARSRSPAPP